MNKILDEVTKNRINLLLQETAKLAEYEYTIKNGSIGLRDAYESLAADKRYIVDLIKQDLELETFDM